MTSCRQALQIAGLNADLDPHHADTWNNLGILLADADDPAGACDAFREALELDPEDPKAHYNLADVLDTLGYPDQARPHWRAYLRHDPAGSPWADHARERLRGTG